METPISDSEDPILVRAPGLVLREWGRADIPHMVSMFNTAEMDRWTPLTHPFDDDVAAAYVELAHQGHAAGVLQLAITRDGQQPLGEVLLFPTDLADMCEFAYAVGAAHRGCALAARAVTALLPLAKAQGYRSARLRVAVDNLASQHAARGAGFEATTDPLARRERKGYVLDMATWTRAIA